MSTLDRDDGCQHTAMPPSISGRTVCAVPAAPAVHAHVLQAAHSCLSMRILQPACLHACPAGMSAHSHSSIHTARVLRTALTGPIPAACTDQAAAAALQAVAACAGNDPMQLSCSCCLDFCHDSWVLPGAYITIFITLTIPAKLYRKVLRGDDCQQLRLVVLAQHLHRQYQDKSACVKKCSC